MDYLNDEDAEEEREAWRQDLKDWEKRQNEYERLCLNEFNCESPTEWRGDIPKDIKLMIDWYKEN